MESAIYLDLIIEYVKSEYNIQRISSHEAVLIFWMETQHGTLIKI